ncbi:hypothetical protein ONZ45_g12523 [Pleurotus djamor]|nr:hypothetical protein ONZ45_g12523 [Pleurotus djamor]
MEATATGSLNRPPSSNRRERRRPAFILTKKEVKLLSITATGNFLDAYDLLIINPVSTILQYLLYDGHPLPPTLEGLLKSAALIGNVIGQLSFGYLGDALGRKAMYGKELIIIIIGTILCLSTPTNILTPDHALVYLAAFRVVVGIGIGGDFPMSTSVTSERAELRKRGVLLAYVSSMQGWGSLIGSLVATIVLIAYKHPIHVEGKIGKLDAAFATLYQRLTLPETPAFEATHSTDPQPPSREIRDGSDETLPPSTTEQQSHLREFIDYFSEWRHGKYLLGTCFCWFLMNMSFYGVNLNQNFVLEQIGFDKSSGSTWQKLIRVSTGDMIITSLGFLPGYYFTVSTIEILGRKWIQIQGCCLTALFMAILAAKYFTLSEVTFVVCFAFMQVFEFALPRIRLTIALMQFFFNFGANMTVYIIPAELFPTRFRAFAYGISAASGKCGAIISALVFNDLSKHVGTPIILWIFFGACLLTAVLTVLLIPEVKGRDADAIYEAERREKEAA